MIHLCPHCGRHLVRPIANGITTCNNCNRVFDTCTLHRILSGAWECRRNGHEYVEQIFGKCKLNESEAILVQLSIDRDYSHDEFLKHVTSKILLT